MVWNAQEQELVNRIEQGVVTAYTPVVTPETLMGHGPAIATNTAIGQIETAMRSMRILGGGRGFNTEIITDDPKRRFQRYYHDKEPLFFDTPRQKEWLEDQRPGANIRSAQKATRDAIVQAAILGKYDTRVPQYAETSDVLGLVKSYQDKEVTYRTSDVDAFTAKVRSLLPGTRAAPPPSAARKKA
jgi:hypothetical protein